MTRPRAETMTSVARRIRRDGSKRSGWRETSGRVTHPAEGWFLGPSPQGEGSPRLGAAETSHGGERGKDVPQPSRFRSITTFQPSPPFEAALSLAW